MKLQLAFPIKGSITQFFGQNSNSLYASDGLLGHPAIDIVSFYDDVITDAVKGFNTKYIYSLLNKENPNLNRYRAVCQIVEADDGVFEIIYGHCNKITCNHGATIFGEPLATEGNTGNVYVGNHYVTAEEKLAGSHAGFHIHFQVRRLRKTRTSTLHSLVGESGSDFIDPLGFHFDPWCYVNGYNGCIDPLQFIGTQNAYKFSKDLSYGSIGTDVLELQKRLIKLGFCYFTPTWFFGDKTKKAVQDYQTVNGIESTGYCGKLTRASLNS